MKKNTLVLSLLLTLPLMACSTSSPEDGRKLENNKVMTESDIQAIQFVSTGALSWAGIKRSEATHKDLALKSLKSQGITVTDGYEKIIINLEEGILFESDDAVLSFENYPKIEGISEILKEIEENSYIEVVGHSDYRGTDAYNKKLSTRRAEAVAGELVRLGLNPKSIVSVKGVGSSEIPDGCIELSCMRRVEIIVTKTDILFKMDK